MTKLPTTAATVLFAICAILPIVGQAETLQDLINEACAPAHYPALPPCGSGITLEELNSRLRYKLEIMKAEDEQMKRSISSWQSLLGLLYMTPTQTVWDSNKKIAPTLSTDLVRTQVNKAIDAQGTLFLANANGNPDLVRRNILLYLMINGWDKDRIEFLKGLKTEAINPKLLFRVQLMPQ